LNNTRAICEEVEDMTFDNIDGVREHLFTEKDINPDFVEVYELSEFVTMVNDEVLDMLTSVFITHVNIK